MSGTWEALTDPTRRAIVEHLARDELTAGEVAALFDTARPGTSRHLRVLREAGLVEVQPVGQRRVYRLAPAALDEVEQWCRDVRSFWGQRLDALDTEIARGARARRQEQG
ncbi:helix-turn-helix transcriptional regulator [Terrabacter sp. MAHUQ-38]|jgi:DNA-binding transcriptional ArsR family regulator|uniref:ArsR/SmtB family transcription factor n=1 Tax=unclassified Terrabacter TaxID=2630222 RepID=UPI00165D950B|nr:metalloregulator ArsR/SmtB family transcription factor [Terrabacter sp. MAHUQ-38]MBC9822019.1 winged helix-turn-helix transcriptional regulator [Terrabacter sp. MAHUQ-38]